MPFHISREQLPQMTNQITDKKKKSEIITPKNAVPNNSTVWNSSFCKTVKSCPESPSLTLERIAVCSLTFWARVCLTTRGVSSHPSWLSMAMAWLLCVSRVAVSATTKRIWSHSVPRQLNYLCTCSGNMGYKQNREGSGNGHATLEENLGNLDAGGKVICVVNSEGSGTWNHTSFSTFTWLVGRLFPFLCDGKESAHLKRKQLAKLCWGFSKAARYLAEKKKPIYRFVYAASPIEQSCSLVGRGHVWKNRQKIRRNVPPSASFPFLGLDK